MVVETADDTWMICEYLKQEDDEGEKEDDTHELRRQSLIYMHTTFPAIVPLKQWGLFSVSSQVGEENETGMLPCMGW